MPERELKGVISIHDTQGYDRQSVFEIQKTYIECMVTYHHTVGKWIIGSLFLLNAAPLAAFSQTSAKVPMLPCALLVAGIYCALSTAFFSWINAGVRSRLFGINAVAWGAENADGSELSKLEAALVGWASRNPMRWMLRFGIASTACFMVGSLLIVVSTTG